MCVAQEDRGDSRVRTTRRVRVWSQRMQSSLLFFSLSGSAPAHRGAVAFSSHLAYLNPSTHSRSFTSHFVFRDPFSSHSFVTVAYHFCQAKLIKNTSLCSFAMWGVGVWRLAYLCSPQWHAAVVAFDRHDSWSWRVDQNAHLNFGRLIITCTCRIVFRFLYIRGT